MIIKVEVSDWSQNSLKILLIIPAYNEEESLEKTIESLMVLNDGIDFLIVNDGSKDDTVRVCRDNKYPFLDLPTNLGLAGALQAGMKYAYRHDYDCVIQFDADGQHLPEYIKPLQEAIESCDIAIGSRYISKEKPLSMRMLGSSLISAAIKLTTGKTIKDPTSGMRAFNKRMIKQFALGLNFGPEPDTVSYLIKRANAKVVEVPVRMAERTAGESYLNVWTSITYMIRMTISILFIQLIRKRIDGGK